MSTEEVTETEKLSDLVNIGGRIRCCNGFQFVGSRFDTFFSEVKTKVSYLFASEVAFLQVDLESVYGEVGEDGVEYKQVFFISACVSQQVVDIDNDVVDIFHD